MFLIIWQTWLITNWWFAKCCFTFDNLDKVIIDHLTNIFSNWIVSDKEGENKRRLQGWHEHNNTWYNIQNEWHKTIVTISNYHKFKTCFGDHKIALSVFKHKMINTYDIEIIQTHTGT